MSIRSSTNRQSVRSAVVYRQLEGVTTGYADNNNNNNNNSNDNVYGAVIMTKVIARVHPVHLMNVD